MILLDLHQTMVANAFALFKLGAKATDEKLLRHMVLNSIRASRLKFKIEYGEFVICSDSRNYWRKEIFPYYKANRVAAKAKSPIDWQTLFPTMDKLKKEFRDNLPYKFIQVDGAEADDVIATLAKNASSQGEPVMIVSGDSDFVQLQSDPNIKQWNPIKKRFIESKTPKQDLMLKILSGDSGDGIPNVLSDDDVFVEKSKRQRPLTQKKIASLNIDSFNRAALTETELRNFDRNRTLIDLSYIPDTVRDRIMETFEVAEVPSPKMLKPYFLNNSLGKLFASIGDF